ncbi:MAG: hypothetical protein ABIO35_08200 [Nitrobacter sp.]
MLAAKISGRSVLRDRFDRDGFVVAEGVFGSDVVAGWRAQVDAVWWLARRGGVSRILVYEDYPHVLGGVNVCGLQDPFHAVPGLSGVFDGGEIEGLIAELTDWRGAEVECAKVHVNDRFRYSGFWHRDATPRAADRSVVAVVYLRDEAGFRIVPSWSEWNRFPAKGDRLQARKSFERLADEAVISAPAGSVLFMKSYLLHRGYSNEKRSHLHLRFIRGQRYDAEGWAAFRNSGAARHKPAGRVRQIKNFLRYLMPGRGYSTWWQI